MPSVRERRSTPRPHALGHGLEPSGQTDTPTRAARDLGPCVYAVRTPERLIKIGYTTNLDRRIRSFGSVWSDVLLALPGTLDEEAALHARFRPHLARGHEYYFPTDDLVAWVNEHRERLGVSRIGRLGL